MNYKRYQAARDLAREVLLMEGVTALPISVSALCRSMGVSLKLYAGGEGSDGKSMMLNDIPTIFVSTRVPVHRQRFTAAHELGHVLLDHVGMYGLVNREPTPHDSPVEHEANVFAARLLAPACVLWGCGVQSAGDIMALCNISQQSAEFQWQRMQLFYERDRFLTSPLERRVYAQFRDYIAAHRL